VRWLKTTSKGGYVMDREIKFRAWDKELKMMVYSKEETGHIEYDTNTVDAINVMLNEDDYGFEFMQYTGIKDKSGKEVCEGDIIEFRMNTYQGTYRGNVIYEHGCFIVDYKIITGFKEYLYQTAQAEEKFEVIGNIYENKDLLNA
jgi:uncharacterized phage protein (TIGR01671 family)